MLSIKTHALAPGADGCTLRLGFSLMVIATMAKLSELLCRSQPMHEPEVTQPPLDQHDACFQVL